MISDDCGAFTDYRSWTDFERGEIIDGEACVFGAGLADAVIRCQG
jgi:hypothetical protein